MFIIIDKLFASFSGELRSFITRFYFQVQRGKDKRELLVDFFFTYLFLKSFCNFFEWLYFAYFLMSFTCCNELCDEGEKRAQEKIINNDLTLWRFYLSSQHQKITTIFTIKMGIYPKKWANGNKKRTKNSFSVIVASA